MRGHGVDRANSARGRGGAATAIPARQRARAAKHDTAASSNVPTARTKPNGCNVRLAPARCQAGRIGLIGRPCSIASTAICVQQPASPAAASRNRSSITAATRKPEFITCLHEESGSVTMAITIAGKRLPLCVTHVGLKHARWRSTTRGAQERRPHHRWEIAGTRTPASPACHHTRRPGPRLADRDFTNGTTTRNRAAFRESMVRAYKIARWPR